MERMQLVRIDKLEFSDMPCSKRTIAQARRERGREEVMATDEEKVKRLGW